jgi:hypothetical protein
VTISILHIPLKLTSQFNFAVLSVTLCAHVTAATAAVTTAAASADVGDLQSFLSNVQPQSLQALLQHASIAAACCSIQQSSRWVLELCCCFRYLRIPAGVCSQQLSG